MLSLNNKIEANDFGKDKKLILNLNSDIPIIIVNGCGGVGKDEFVKALDELITVFSYSTIDTYKKIAKESFDWDEVKDEKGRKLLSDLKLAGINYNDAPKHTTTPSESAGDSTDTEESTGSETDARSNDETSGTEDASANGGETSGTEDTSANGGETSGTENSSGNAKTTKSRK